MTSTTYDPIIEVRDLPRFAPRIRPPLPGTALVLERGHGELIVIRGTPVPSSGLRNQYHRSFLVDMSEHHLQFMESIPTKDFAFTFQCTVTVTCSVRDPGTVVHRGIRDAAAAFRAPIVRSLRETASRFDISLPHDAERAITDHLSYQPISNEVFHLSGFLVELIGDELDARSGSEYRQAQRERRLAEISGALAREAREVEQRLDIEAREARQRLDIEAQEAQQRLALDSQAANQRMEILRLLLESDAINPEHRSILDSLGLLNTSSADEQASDTSRPELLAGHETLRERIHRTRQQYEDWATVDAWPVYVYLSDDSGEIGGRVSSLLQDIWHELGFEMVTEGEPVLGSFFQRFRAKATSPEAQQALLERLTKLERAAEVRALAVPESLANMQNAQGLAALIQSLSGETSAAVMLGPLLILKTTNADGTTTVNSKLLSARELRALERRPELLKDPETVLLLLGPSTPEEPDGDSATA